MIGPLREQIGVTIDTNAVGPALESKTGEIRAALARKMDYTTASLQSIIVGEKLQGQVLKHRTGKLANSVRPLETVVTSDDISGGVVAGGGVAPYARPLEYGSRAHAILPVSKKALHFFVNGKEVFATKVMHPGTRAYAFMRGTLDEQSQQIIAGFQEAAAEAASS